MHYKKGFLVCAKKYQLVSAFALFFISTVGWHECLEFDVLLQGLFRQQYHNLKGIFGCIQAALKISDTRMIYLSQRVFHGY